MKPDASQIERSKQANIACYSDYYAKPSWWFRLRYNTQVKRKTCLHLVRKVGKSLSHQRVLEIGFGSGDTLFSFDNTCEIYGIEISDSAIKHARLIADKRGYRSCEFLPARSGPLPYNDDSFDIVIASHVLEHVEDDSDLLMEFHRVMKPDGIVVILVPVNEVYNDPNHIRRYTFYSLAQLSEDLGFRVLYGIENELLFRLVEKYYYEDDLRRLKILRTLFAACFHLPTAILPIQAYETLEVLLRKVGYKPRQAGLVLAKIGRG